MIQSNDPNDLTHAYWNKKKREQQDILSKLNGGSWSQPPWRGWNHIIGAGYGGFSKYGGEDFLQRYAQDGDSGFFFRKGIWGGAEPLGSNHLPLNTLPEIDTYQVSTEQPTYKEPMTSTIEPPIVQPSPQPNLVNLEMETSFTAEPQQRATHVPPYSHLLKQGMGQVTDEKSALHEEAFEIPPYKGAFHKKKKIGYY